MKGLKNTQNNIEQCIIALISLLQQNDVSQYLAEQLQ